MVDYVEGVCVVCGERPGSGNPCACIRSLGGDGGGGISIEEEDRRQRKWEKQQQQKLEQQKLEREKRERKERDRQCTASGGSLVSGMIRQLFSFSRKKKLTNSSSITTSTQNSSHKSRKEQIEQYEKDYLAQIEQQQKVITSQQNDVNSQLIKLPDEGTGYRVKKDQKNLWADQIMIAFIQNIGKKWNDIHPDKKLVITEISKEGGGQLGKHREHKYGLDVDIRPFRNDMLDEGTTWKDKKHYDRKLMREFLDILHADNEVKKIYFNDDVLLKENHPSLQQKRYPKMMKMKEHDNHLHISLD